MALGVLGGRVRRGLSKRFIRRRYVLEKKESGKRKAGPYVFPS